MFLFFNRHSSSILPIFSRIHVTSYLSIVFFKSVYFEWWKCHLQDLSPCIPRRVSSSFSINFASSLMISTFINVTPSLISFFNSEKLTVIFFELIVELKMSLSYKRKSFDLFGFIKNQVTCSKLVLNVISFILCATEFINGV